MIKRDGFVKVLGGFGVQLGKAQVQTAERGIGDEKVHKPAGVYALVPALPILRAEQHVGARGMKVVSEGPVGAQRFF